MAKRSHTLVHFWLIQMKGNATVHYNATTVPFCTQSKVNEEFFLIFNIILMMYFMLWNKT